MIEAGSETNEFKNEPKHLKDAFENSSLVKTVGLIEATKVPKPSFQSLDLVLPAALEKQRINYAISKASSFELIAKDPEFESLWQDLVEEPKKHPYKKLNCNEPTEEAMKIYGVFLASDAPLLGKITAASPVFRNYMRRTAEWENLGPFFKRILKELEKGEVEIAAFLISSEAHLEVFERLDHTYGWLQDRLKIRKGESWEYFEAMSKLDSDKKDDYLEASQRELDRRENLIKASSQFRQFSNKMLDIYFDSNDKSQWREFIRDYFPIVMAGFRFFDPEDFSPEKQYERLQKLFGAVNKEDWDYLSAYFVWSGWGRNKNAVKVLEPQILEGDLEKTKVFVAFNHTIESKDAENLFYKDEAEAIDYWVDQFAEGKLSNEQFLNIANMWVKRRKALFSHREPYRAELGFAAVPLLTKLDTYNDGDTVADLTMIGLNPTPEIREIFKKSEAYLGPLKDFTKSIIHLTKNDFHSIMLPVVTAWAERYLSGEIEGENLKKIVPIIEKIKKVEEGIVKDEGFSEGDKNSFRQFTLSMYLQKELGEADPEKLITPEIILDLVKKRIYPTPKITQYIAENGIESVNQLLNSIKEINDGNFDRNNELHWELEFSRYLKMYGTKDIDGSYEKFKQIPYVEEPKAPTSISKKDVKEAEFAALEAARVYWLIKERVDAGRNVLVVANERYGKLFVADPLEEELKSLQVRVETAYVRSGAAKEGTVEKIFDERTERFIKEEKPDVIIIDGTASPVVAKAKKKEPRFSRAMIAFNNCFSENELDYNVAFWSFLESAKATLGDVKVPFKKADYNKPQAIIVNSTIDPKFADKFSEKLEDHDPGYFDDYEGNPGRNLDNFIISKNGLTNPPRMSSARYLSAVQRRIKEALPSMIMSKESDLYF